jgi:hypothetical protein
MANKYILSALVLLLLGELIAAGGWEKLKESVKESGEKLKKTATKSSKAVFIKAPKAVARGTGKFISAAKERMDGPDWSAEKDRIETIRRNLRPSAHGNRD